MHFTLIHIVSHFEFCVFDLPLFFFVYSSFPFDLDTISIALVNIYLPQIGCHVKKNHPLGKTVISGLPP